MQETKIKDMNDMVIKDVWGKSSSHWLALPSCGASGGIVLIWNEDKVVVVEHEVSAFSIQFKLNVEWVGGMVFHWVLWPCSGKKLMILSMSWIMDLPWCCCFDSLKNFTFLSIFIKI